MNEVIPGIDLAAGDGSRARLALQGAQPLSWITADGRERLFLSRATGHGPGRAIRGGVPVIFPQFALRGPLPRHGWVRDRSWTPLRTAPDRVCMGTEDDAATRAVWPGAYRLEFEVALLPAALWMRLRVYNTGTSAFGFTAALHSYLRVDDIAQARVLGLQGLDYEDSAGGELRRQTDPELGVHGETDRIYFHSPSRLLLWQPNRLLALETEGFADTVIWNPGAERGAALADLEEGGWRRMLCIEAAQIGAPIQLAAGHSWTGTQRLIAGPAA